jgi:hypothetical protein
MTERLPPYNDAAEMECGLCHHMLWTCCWRCHGCFGTCGLFDECPEEDD